MKEFFIEKITLKVYSQKGESKINIHFEICGIDYGIGDVSLAAWTTCNLKTIIWKKGPINNAYQCQVVVKFLHVMKYNRQWWFEINFILIQQSKDDFNKTQEPNLFKVVEATPANYKDMKKVRVECTWCNKWFCLVPTSGNIASSLNKQMKSKNHTATTTNEHSHEDIGLRSGTVGRPKKPTNDKSQQSLTRFLVPLSPSILHRGSTSADPSTSGVLIKNLD